MVEIRGSATKRRPSFSSESVGSSILVLETGEEVVGPSIGPTINNKGKEPMIMKRVKLVEPLKNARPSPPFVAAPPRSPPPRSPSPPLGTPSPTPPSISYTSWGSNSSSENNKDDDKEELIGYFVTSYNMLYPHGCDLCEDRFKEEAELKVHRRTHRPPPGRPRLIDVFSSTALRMKNIAKQKQPIVPPPPLPTVPFLTSLPPRPTVQPSSLFKPLFASSSSQPPPPRSTPFMVATPQAQAQAPPPRAAPFGVASPQAQAPPSWSIQATPPRSVPFGVASPQAQAPPSWSIQATPPRSTPFMVAPTQRQAPPQPPSTILTLGPASTSTQGMPVAMIGGPSGVSLELGLQVGSSERVQRWPEACRPMQAGPSHGYGQWSGYMEGLEFKANGVGSNGPRMI